MSNKFQHPTRIWNTTTAIDTKTFLPNSANLSGSISHGNLFLNSDMETLNELITSWERACIDYDAATRPILRAIRQEIARHDDVELIIDALSKSFSMNWHWCLLRRVDRVRRRTTDQKYIPSRPGLGRPRSKRWRRNWCRWLWHGFRRQRCRVRQRNWAIENINHPNSPPFLLNNSLAHHHSFIQTENDFNKVSKCMSKICCVLFGKESSEAWRTEAYTKRQKQLYSNRRLCLGHW